jgi:hypothetical protein
MSNIETVPALRKGGRTWRDPSRLTPRERELLIVLEAQGNYAGVAKALGLGRANISERFAIIRQKLSVDTNEAAILAAKGKL